jgi:beta-glucanase (GH16 family)
MLILLSFLLINRIDSLMLDPDTRLPDYTILRRKDKRQLHLVMSDEFNVNGREFHPGKDPLFEALQKPDYTNEAIQFCKLKDLRPTEYSIVLFLIIDNSSTEYVTTRNGSLVLTTRAVKTTWVEWDIEALKPRTSTKNYTSGMIQTWNKFCFTGGVLKMSIKLPGRHDSGGGHSIQPSHALPAQICLKPQDYGLLLG